MKIYRTFFLSALLLSQPSESTFRELGLEEVKSEGWSSSSLSNVHVINSGDQQSILTCEEIRSLVKNKVLNSLQELELNNQPNLTDEHIADLSNNPTFSRLCRVSLSGCSQLTIASLRSLWDSDYVGSVRDFCTLHALTSKPIAEIRVNITGTKAAKEAQSYHLPLRGSFSIRFEPLTSVLEEEGFAPYPPTSDGLKRVKGYIIEEGINFYEIFSKSTTINADKLLFEIISAQESIPQEIFDKVEELKLYICSSILHGEYESGLTNICNFIKKFKNIKFLALRSGQSYALYIMLSRLSLQKVATLDLSATLFWQLLPKMPLVDIQQRFPNLKEIYLSEGELTDKDLDELKITNNINLLYLLQNNLTGRTLKKLLQLENLEKLYLGFNRLHEEFPEDEFYDLLLQSRVRELDLRKNNLSLDKIFKPTSQTLPANHPWKTETYSFYLGDDNSLPEEKIEDFVKGLPQIMDVLDLAYFKGVEESNSPLDYSKKLVNALHHGLKRVAHFNYEGNLQGQDKEKLKSHFERLFKNSQICLDEES